MQEARPQAQKADRDERDGVGEADALHEHRDDEHDQQQHEKRLDGGVQRIGHWHLPLNGTRVVFECVARYHDAPAAPFARARLADHEHRP